MRTGIAVQLSPTDCKRLQAIVDDSNSPQKRIWRARIVLATADGLGTAAIMRTADGSKTSVWRRQERLMTEGVDGLLRDPLGVSQRAARQRHVRPQNLTLQSDQRGE